MSAVVSSQNRRTDTEPSSVESFIELQFPIAKISKESYAERRANQSQTITGLGKWWGRKPLVLCRAAILGLLLPNSGNPGKDRDAFLRLMTMDDDGLLRRKSSNIPAKELHRLLLPSNRNEYFEPGSSEQRPKLKRSLTPEDKEDLQRRVFLSLPYELRLQYCDRPEQIEGPSRESWSHINSHLGTQASSIAELVNELSIRRFGHRLRVGDAFCGGGSVPFEAARLGCAAYGSDLNPVAGLLSWASIHVVGGGRRVAEQVLHAQREVYAAVDKQIAEWGIEHRVPDCDTGRRWRADAYLYCTETTCPECGWRIPLAASWVVGPTSRVVAVLRGNSTTKAFDIEIRNGASDEEIAAAATGTVIDGDVYCPNCRKSTPLRVLRGDGRGTFGESRSLLRAWKNEDFMPGPEDIFQERLYCIRWVDSWTETDFNGNEKQLTERHFLAPTSDDLQCERRVASLLRERFAGWQERGYIPKRRIEPGLETTRLQRERGWTFWHHLFAPRQLLVNGLFLEQAAALQLERTAQVAALLGAGRCADWNSRLCRWGTGAARESIAQTFSNQALNTLFNYASKGLSLLQGSWFPISPVVDPAGSAEIIAQDVRSVTCECDFWVTDPPYADAVNYHELSEFFIAWYAEQIGRLFPSWAADSRRALAVQGSDESFREAMASAYRRLVEQMPDNGAQLVMFTHQDPSVWADLALILWGAGLRVSAAWCIQTEREASGTREGNYVQGTVILVLRKNLRDTQMFLDEAYQQVETEVRRQLDAMRDLDDAKDPSFSDTDYQLAAYAAALRVLTGKKIEEIDVAYELTRSRGENEKSPVQEIIERAVAIACDHLLPRGIDAHVWKSLSSMERLYVKGVELESHGERRAGVYQELARGFGVDEYRNLLASTKANQARLRTATEFGRKEMSDTGFGSSLVRHALFATFKAADTESPREALAWLKTEVKDYGANRQRVIALLDYFAALRQNASLDHWHKDAEAAALVAGALRNREDNI